MKMILNMGVLISTLGFPGSTSHKEPANAEETGVQSLGQEDPLQEGMVTHFRILAWRIP